jgi:branched-chain amino acid transport system substrate-binding protein
MNLGIKIFFSCVVVLVLCLETALLIAEPRSRDFYSTAVFNISGAVAFSFSVFIASKEEKNSPLRREQTILAIGICLMLASDLSLFFYDYILDVAPSVPSVADFFRISSNAVFAFQLLPKLKDAAKKKPLRLLLVAAGNALFFAIMVYLIYQSSYLVTQRGVLMFSTLVAYPAVHALVMVPAITILVVAAAGRSEYVVDTIFQLISILILVLSDSWLAAAFLSHSLDQFWLSDLFFVIDYILLVAGLIWYACFSTPSRRTSLARWLLNLGRRLFSNFTLLPFSPSPSPSLRSAASSSPPPPALPFSPPSLRNRILGSFVAIILFFYSSPSALAIVVVAVAGGTAATTAIFISSLENPSANPSSQVHPAAGSPSSSTTIKLGALLPLTGIWSSTGGSQRSQVEKAVADMNSYFYKSGQNETVSVLVQDTRSDPKVALERLQFLESQGVKVVLGPQTSAEVAAVKEYADSRGIIILSAGSTAPSLSIKGDNVFRFVPDDSNQGLAAAKMMQSEGIKVVVPMWRDDTYGNDLVTSMKEHFQKEVGDGGGSDGAGGGLVMEGVKYHADTGAFSSSLNRMNFVIWERDLKKLESQVSQATSSYGANAVAVYIAAFDEATPIFIQANDHESLRSIKWYGSDGIANNKAMVANPVVADFMSKTDFKIPAYIADARGNNDDNDNNNNNDEVKDNTGAISPRPIKYDDVLYDATKIASLAEASSLKQDRNDIEALKTAIVKTATNFEGVSGRISLNDAGDRIFNGSFGYTKVTRDQNGVLAWELFVNEYANATLASRTILSAAN